MLPAVVSGVLTVALAGVVGWCLFALVRRPTSAATDRVPMDLEAWHGVMGAAMLPLLWWMPSTDLAWLGCGLFAAMTLWCAVLGSARPRGHYGQVGLMAVVMLAMLVPAGAANAAAPPVHAAAMSGMHDDVTSRGLIVAGPAALAAVLVLLLVAMLAIGRARRAVGTRTRLSASCEAVMASAMALMALAMV